MSKYLVIIPNFHVTVSNLFLIEFWSYFPFIIHASVLSWQIHRINFSINIFNDCL